MDRLGGVGETGSMLIDALRGSAALLAVTLASLGVGGCDSGSLVSDGVMVEDGAAREGADAAPASDAGPSDAGADVDGDAGGRDAGAPDGGEIARPLIVYDFAGGDTMADDRDGFSWNGEREISTAEGSSEAGAELAHGGTVPSRDSSSEIRYRFPQTLDLYQRIRLQVPTNYFHRATMWLRVADADADVIAAWELGDEIVGADGTSRGPLAEIQLEETRVWLEFADNPGRDSAWVGTVTNETRDETVEVTRRSSSPGNNKLWAIWMDGYSSHGWGPTVVWEFWPHPDVRGGSVLAVHWSPGEQTGANGHRMHTPFFLVPEDRGRHFDIITRVVAASDRSTDDGIVQLWLRKDGEDGYRLIHDVQNADNPPPVEEPDNPDLARQWARGYLMGWSNSGYEERTVFRLSRYEYWGSTRPPDLPPE